MMATRVVPSSWVKRLLALAMFAMPRCLRAFAFDRIRSSLYSPLPRQCRSGFRAALTSRDSVAATARQLRRNGSSASDHAEETCQFQQEASKHKKAYRIRGRTSEEGRVGVRLTTNTGHVLQTDLPRLAGGADRAAQPVELLLAALAGCTQATAVFVGRNLRPRRLVIERIEFDLEAWRDERGALSLPVDAPPGFPSRLRSVTGTVLVYAARNEPIDDSILELLKEQTEIRCPVANMMLASGCDMNVRWVDGTKEDVT